MPIMRHESYDVLGQVPDEVDDIADPLALYAP